MIIVAASFLTAAAPPAQYAGAAYDQTQHVSGYRLELLASSTTPGRNRYALRVHQGLVPVTGAEKVAFRFTMVEHDMGEQELVATERAPGEYVADGSATAMFGTWRIQTIVRLAGQEDVNTVFTFPVSTPAGAAATSRVLQIGTTYTLIVFTDPSQPQAGAPLTLYGVLVDASGSPVTGKSVRATFSGPAAPISVDAKQDPATLGPGRYAIALAALDPGKWNVEISVGADGSATTTLDVSR